MLRRNAEPDEVEIWEDGLFEALEEADYTCALDVVDDHRTSRATLCRIFGLARVRLQQLERAAMHNLTRAASRMDLRSWITDAD